MRLPTMQEELERKTLEAAGNVLRRLETHEINAAQASEAMRAVFDAVSGLIPMDTLDLVCAVRDHAPETFVDRVVLVKTTRGPDITVIEHAVGTGVVRFLSKPDGKANWTTNKILSFDAELHPAAAAVAKITEFTEALLARGWRRA